MNGDDRTAFSAAPGAAESPVTDESFLELMQRVRAGDHAAAERLVRLYESDVRRAIRVRLTDARLRRVLDSIDVCQSVLANFFVRAAAGQFELSTPEQLLRLLVTMARNRLTDWARRQQADVRDGRRDVPLDGDDSSGIALSAPGPSPSSIVAGRELISEYQRRMTSDERQIMEFRFQGASWDDIAAQLGGKASAARMRLVRALDRVSAELGLGSAVDV